MTVSYCRRWNSLLHAPIEPMSEDEARALDAAGTLYCAVVGGPGQVDAVVEVVRGSGYFGVYFFDTHERQKTKFDFGRRPEGGLFLNTVIAWQYPDDRPRRQLNEASRIDEVQYKPEGTVRHIVRDKAADEKTTTDFRDVPLDINHEPEPAFGDWASIARFERAPKPAG
ncbi:hypothetical protein ACFO1B_21220 [Dactylosporangium siamense]|uniref:Uncharacterized protein n=1 Tax=Dactylosporangium siamense TaxID=685454 RepID=A0A919PML9_9ACTN|nr:hypothetical protein [Dactylosporangium siamense]GIG46739.1 hypothetical protein Dsi01nite_047800 [Dactylosporangium siamense]